MADSFELRNKIDARLSQAAAILNVCMESIGTGHGLNDDIEYTLWAVKDLVSTASEEFHELQTIAHYEDRERFVLSVHADSGVDDYELTEEDEAFIAELFAEKEPADKKAATKKPAGKSSRSTMVKGKKK